MSATVTGEAEVTPDTPNGASKTIYNDIQLVVYKKEVLSTGSSSGDTERAYWFEDFSGNKLTETHTSAGSCGHLSEENGQWACWEPVAAMLNKTILGQFEAFDSTDLSAKFLFVLTDTP